MVTAARVGTAGRVSEDGIRRLVHLFYARVRRDDLLGPVFARALGETDAAWAAHLARLCATSGPRSC